jgi:hypothetical protein
METLSFCKNLRQLVCLHKHKKARGFTDIAHMVCALHQIVEEVLRVVFTKTELKVSDDLREGVSSEIALIDSVLAFVIVLE